MKSTTDTIRDWYKNGLVTSFTAAAYLVNCTGRSERKALALVAEWGTARTARAVHTR